MATKKAQVLECLARIQCGEQDCVTRGFIRDLIVRADAVSFSLDCNAAFYEDRHRIKAEATQAISELDWAKTVDIQFIPQSKSKHKLPGGLDRVKKIIAVSSCKGGVGKSTIAVNLAFELAKQGYQVGCADADIYGPSLDTLVYLDPEALGMIDNQLVPKLYQGVKLMSFAYTQDPHDPEPAVMRGPMATRLINQLVANTQWGNLDYLVLDLPPGTGDIHITLAQMMAIDAAIIITTPQSLSLVDVIKGIHMFDSLNIPTLAVVENMSYFTCTDCNAQHYPFGSGARDYLTQHYGFDNTIQLPLDAAFTQACDHGVPFVCAYPDHKITRKITELTQTLVRQLDAPQAYTTNQASYDDAQHLIRVRYQDTEYALAVQAVRAACPCALCTDASGNLVEPKNTPVLPADIQPVGRYAVGIQWQDNHASLYPYKTLIALGEAA